MSLSLRVKASITAVSVIALSFMILLIIFSEDNRKSALEKENQYLHETLDDQITYLNDNLDLIDRDMSFLISNPEVPAIFFVPPSNSKQININSKKLVLLRNEFARFLVAKDKYLKLDIYGKENGWDNIISVKKNGNTDHFSDSGSPIKKKHKYPYSSEIESLSSNPANAADIIKWSLENNDKTNLVILSISRPVYNKSGGLLGVIVLKIDFTNKIMRITDRLRSSDHLIIGFSGSGYVLHIYDSNKGNNEQVSKHYHLLGVEHNKLPEFVPKHVEQHENDKNINDFLFFHRNIKLSCGNVVTLYIGESIAKLRNPYFLVLDAPWYTYLALFLFVSWLGVLLSWWPLRQLNQIGEVVKGIADGTASSEDLPINLGNEVGDLSRAFNKLLGKLEETEKDVHASKEQMELAIKGSAAGIWDWDLITNDVYLSPRWKEMLGYRDEEIENNIDEINKLIHPDDLRNKWNKINDYISGDLDRYVNEFRMLHKDGQYISVLSRAYIVRDKSNKPIRLVGMHTDITYRKQEEERRIAYEKEQKETLIREVHHRIKNNLQGVASLLRQHALRDPEIKEHLASAISQVYTMAKVHGLQGANIYEAISLSKMIAEIADMVSNYSGENIIHRDIKGCCDCMLHEKESVPIALILNELIMNACKHKDSKDSEDREDSVLLECKWNKNKSVSISITNKIDSSVKKEEERSKSVGTGLELVKSLLPPEGAKLELGENNGRFIAKLELMDPVIYGANESGSCNH